MDMPVFETYLSFAVLVAIGFGAGITTTTVGAGGGIALLAVLALLRPMYDAMVISSLALLAGNVHRMWLFRRDVAWSAIHGCVVGVFVGSIAGGLIAARLSDTIVRIVVVISLCLSVWVKQKRIRTEYRPRVLVLVGALLGTFTALSGGIGILFAPILFSMGLVGDRYVASSVLLSVVAHSSRLVAFSSNGWFQTASVLAAVLVSVGILLGNRTGFAIRKKFTQEVLAKNEFRALCIVGVLNVLGFTK